MDIHYSVNKKLVTLKVLGENIFKVYELITTTTENQLLLLTKPFTIFPPNKPLNKLVLDEPALLIVLRISLD